MPRVLDTWIEQMALRLDALPRSAFAIFFAYLAERLLPLYVAFQQKHGWGDIAAMEGVLEAVWKVLSGLPGAGVQGGIQRLEVLTPSGEGFDSPDSTYAQDAVICVDAAVRALTPGESLNSGWVEYAIEPVKTKVSVRKSGYMSMEGEVAEAWEAQLMADPELAIFLKDCEDLIARLESATNILNIDSLRMEARSKAIQPNEYFG